MAKARAILRRRKAVRNIRKITKTMNMIATAKFQRVLKRAVGTKPFARKLREVVHDLVESVAGLKHPLLRIPGENDRCGRIALLVITSNRGLCGAYNGNVLQKATEFILAEEKAGRKVDLYVYGKKGQAYFRFQKRALAPRADSISDEVRYEEVEKLADFFISSFRSGRCDAVHVAYMDFVSTGLQRPEVVTLLPLAGAKEAAEHVERQSEEGEEQARAGLADFTRRGKVELGKLSRPEPPVYDFMPSAGELLDELLPQTVRMTLFQCFLDASASENVARMVAMKNATDNADKMIRTLTMQANRARQSQITTELSEIMSGVEAMKD